MEFSTNKHHRDSAKALHYEFVSSSRHMLSDKAKRFNTLKEEYPQKSYQFLDSLTSLTIRHVYKLLIQSNKIIKSYAKAKTHREMFGDVMLENVYKLPRKVTKLNKLKIFKNKRTFLSTNYLLFNYKSNLNTLSMYCAKLLAGKVHLWWKYYTG